MARFQRVRSSFVDDEPEAPAAFAPEDESVGELLRRQRTEMGLDLLEVAAALKIKPAYLAAIEGGRLGQLPGAPYAVGFVRSYSDYLRLDTVEILRRFKLEAAGLDAKPDLTFPMPLGERSVPAGRIMIVAVILAICGYGGWYYISTVDRSMPERTAEVPAELVGARPEPGSASKSPPAKPAENLAQTREPVAPTNAPGSTEELLSRSKHPPKLTRRQLRQLRRQKQARRQSHRLPPRPTLFPLPPWRRQASPPPSRRPAKPALKRKPPQQR